MKDTFTEVTRKDFYLWQGAIKKYIPELKKLHTEKGVKLTTVGDANKGRLKKYNSDESNRTILNNTNFHIVGSIIVSNGLKGIKHQQGIIYDIEDSPLMKARVLAINKNTKINETYGFSFGNSQEEVMAIFQDIKELAKDGKARIISSPDINGFNNNRYHNPQERNIIYFGLNGSDNSFHKEFTKHVQGVTGKKFADKKDGVMGICLSTFFEGWHPIILSSVGNGNADVGRDYGFDDGLGCLLAGSVGDATDLNAESVNVYKNSLEDKSKNIYVQNAINIFIELGYRKDVAEKYANKIILTK